METLGLNPKPLNQVPKAYFEPREPPAASESPNHDGYLPQVQAEPFGCLTGEGKVKKLGYFTKVGPARMCVHIYICVCVCLCVCRVCMYAHYMYVYIYIYTYIYIYIFRPKHRVYNLDFGFRILSSPL